MVRKPKIPGTTNRSCGGSDCEPTEAEGRGGHWWAALPDGKMDRSARRGRDRQQDSVGFGAEQTLTEIRSCARGLTAAQHTQTSGFHAPAGISSPGVPAGFLPWSALPPDSRKRAVWIIHQDAEEQLEQLANVVGTAGTTPPSSIGLYMPAGAAGNEFPLLKG